MKLLLSCPNSNFSLLGYDWTKEELFFAIPSYIFTACSIEYYSNSLLVSSENEIRRISPYEETIYYLGGRYNNLAHSVKIIDKDKIAVVDTGNTRVIVIDASGRVIKTYNPLESWGNIPQDTIHLNDVVQTPYGLLASCFDYRPWRYEREKLSWQQWCSGGFGLILNLSEEGRVIGCGLNHPHSLTYKHPYLYVCSSATGEFHVFEFNKNGILREKQRYRICNNHFLRGALYTKMGWFLGGSCRRHEEVISKNMKIYLFNQDTCSVEGRVLDMWGEIYDILPWREDILEPIIRNILSYKAKEYATSK